MTRSASASVHGSIDSRKASNPVVARSTNSSFTSPATTISRATAFASAMSVPTSMPSQRSAHCAEAERRGSTTISRAPRLTALSAWWNQIGWASRAFEPQSTIRSAASRTSW